MPEPSRTTVLLFVPAPSRAQRCLPVVLALVLGALFGCRRSSKPNVSPAVVAIANKILAERPLDPALPDHEPKGKSPFEFYLRTRASIQQVAERSAPLLHELKPLVPPEVPRDISLLPRAMRESIEEQRASNSEEGSPTPQRLLSRILFDLPRVLRAASKEQQDQLWSKLGPLLDRFEPMFELVAKGVAARGPARTLPPHEVWPEPIVAPYQYPDEEFVNLLILSLARRAHEGRWDEFAAEFETALLCMRDMLNDPTMAISGAIGSTLVSRLADLFLCRRTAPAPEWSPWPEPEPRPLLRELPPAKICAAMRGKLEAASLPLTPLRTRVLYNLLGVHGALPKALEESGFDPIPCAQVITNCLERAVLLDAKGLFRFDEAQRWCEAFGVVECYESALAALPERVPKRRELASCMPQPNLDAEHLVCSLATLKVLEKFLAMQAGADRETADPFGVHIRSERRDGELWLWSRGWDLRDDGGDVEKDLVWTR